MQGRRHALALLLCVSAAAPAVAADGGANKESTGLRLIFSTLPAHPPPAHVALTLSLTRMQPCNHACIRPHDVCTCKAPAYLCNLSLQLNLTPKLNRAHLCNRHLFQVFLQPQLNLSLQLNLTPKLNRAHLCNGHLFQVFSPALESLTEQPAITSQARSHQGLLPICPQELRARRGEI